ncbi:serine hydrolase domain-containing protein [Acidobacteriota bacterium]
MKRFGMSFFLALSLVFSLGPMAVDSALSADDESPDIVKGNVGKKLDDYLTRITPFGFSGALLVAQEGEVILNKGYGEAIRSEKIPNTSSTVFTTGSITKQFTAAGIMKLEMMEKLHTQDPLSKYFKDIPTDKKEITLHHLLTHSSGVVDTVGRDYDRALRDDTAIKILNAPLQFTPGKRFSYSNAGYSLLAAVIEKVSGQKYEEFVHEHLFIPAGMEFTGYRIPKWKNKVVAHWYTGEKDNGTPLEKSYPYWNLLGNGGILSTTMDMYRWHLALLEYKVLNAEVKKKIFTPYINEYGYGWDVISSERGLLIQHDGGSSLGGSAEMRRYIDAGVVTILFCNQSYGQEVLFYPVRDKIENLIFGGDVVLPPLVKSVPAEKLRKFEGDYTLESGDVIKVKYRNQRLRVTPTGQEAVTALFAVEPAMAKEFLKLNTLTEDVLNPVLKGDYDKLAEVLSNKKRRLSPVCQLISMRLEQDAKRTGEINKVIARVTLPAEFRENLAAQTFVQFKGEKGSIYFSLFWQDMINVGIAPEEGVPDLSVPFQPLDGSVFAGYHLDMARNFKISFLIDEKGSVTGLIIPSGSEKIKAKRS